MSGVNVRSSQQAETLPPTGALPPTRRNPRTRPCEPELKSFIRPSPRFGPPSYPRPMPTHKVGDRAIAWLPPQDIEESALKQIHNLAGLPIVFRHVAIMPDCHLGKGATVGTVVP